MPCYITGSREGDLELSSRQASQRATEAARAACEALSIVEARGDLAECSAETQEWWAEHKRIDRERAGRESELERIMREHEQAKRDALAKLTDEERRVLGVWHP